MAEKRRLEKLSEQLRDELGALIEAGLDDPRVGLVAVTGVALSPDMRYARVYISSLGGEIDRKVTFAGLASARGYLRRQLSQRLPHLKRTPELTFHYDEAVERGMRIEAILAELHPKDEDEE